MEQTLYLTAAEIALWKKLSSAMTKHWTPIEETLTFTDTDEKRAVRWADAKFASPILQKLRDKAASVKTEQEARSLMENAVEKSLSQEDFFEICFAAGPAVVTEILWSMLHSVGKAEECEQIAVFSTIRHGLLLSQQSTFSL